MYSGLKNSVEIYQICLRNYNLSSMFFDNEPTLIYVRRENIRVF